MIFWYALNKIISIGDFSLYSSQVVSFGSSVSRIANTFGGIYRNTLELEDYYELLDSKKALDYTKSIKYINNLKNSEKSFSVEFKNITFSYPESDKKVFDNFNLKINPGEKIAMVGINGAGKSTLIKLLLRFYDPQSGEVLINNINIKEIDLDQYYLQVGVLFQQFKKYEMTVKDNVWMGNVEEINNDAEIKDALEESSAMEFVKDYPNKLGQMLGKIFKDGIEPSGGQWQKIALARAFFRNAELLILDEPTSSIDAKAESEIFEKVELLSKDKTVIIISHRFSTVRNADRIVVIDNGKILEQGSHEELISLRGKYAELFELQAKGYR